ncbi:hypothetical protein LZ198_10285 [Myxococcus sp. K15C18031901]|uniref:hypothetical protein n=1 Tax=Myxococcus dinghuensis TaxID=2906761 RepID=UPI0020A7535D|nr:hypothetical protein [Myxococcus dinghuensis]MCP3099258.1 hypothetical protein [Myxococcus dinghuensis]
MKQVDCVELFPTFAPASPRAAPAIVAKGTLPFVEFLAWEPRGSLLSIEVPATIHERGRLRRWSGPRLALEAELPDVLGPGALSPDGRWLLAGGALVKGQAASCLVIDLHAFQVVHTLPVMRPFVWLDDEHFIAQSPNWQVAFTDEGVVRAETRRVAPSLATAVPALVTPEPALVRVSRSTLTCEPLLPSLLLDEEVRAVLSPDGDVLYSATRFSRISAVRLSDARLLWQRPPSRVITEGFVADLALDPTSNRLVTVGGGVTHDMLVLDAASGDELAHHSLDALSRGKVAGPTTLRGEAIRFREDGLGVVATNHGLVIELGRDGRWSAYKAGSRAFRTLAFSADGGTLVLGGSEKNLRAVTLPPVEARP